MTNSSSTLPAAPARACYYVRFASAVHGGPVASPIYATSPQEALATFNADGPAVQVLAVSGPDGVEHDPVDLTETEHEMSDTITYRIECTDAIGNRRVIRTENADIADETFAYWQRVYWATDVTRAVQS